MSVQTYDLLISRHVNFPWTKLWTLWRNPAIYVTQMEDNYPSPETIDFTSHENDPYRLFFLVMRGSFSIGYLMAVQKTSVMSEIHVGFRLNVPGHVKLKAIQIALNHIHASGITTITAPIPEFNRPARFLAGALGFVRTGVLPKSFRQKNCLHDIVIFSRGGS